VIPSNFVLIKDENRKRGGTQAKVPCNWVPSKGFGRIPKSVRIHKSVKTFSPSNASRYKHRQTPKDAGPAL
jgi:hypothetical protein